MNIHRREILEKVARRSGLPLAQVEAVADLLAEEIKEAIHEKRSITWSGFGFLRVTEERPLSAVHPATGEAVQIEARTYFDLFTT